MSPLHGLQPRKLHSLTSTIPLIIPLFLCPCTCLLCACSTADKVVRGVLQSDSDTEPKALGGNSSLIDGADRAVPVIACPVRQALFQFLVPRALVQSRGSRAERSILKRTASCIQEILDLDLFDCEACRRARTHLSVQLLNVVKSLGEC